MSVRVCVCVCVCVSIGSVGSVLFCLVWLFVGRCLSVCLFVCVFGLSSSHSG